MSNPYTPEQVEHLVDDLRTQYVQLRRMTRPSYTARGSDNAAWGKLAVLLLEKNLNGRHYLRWAHEFYRRMRPEVYASQLASPKTVQIYLKNTASSEKDRITDLRLKITIQNNVIRTELQLGRELQEILLDEELAIGIVLRYVMAVGGEFDDLIQLFRAEAEKEIDFEPLYKLILGDKLPPLRRG